MDSKIITPVLPPKEKVLQNAQERFPELELDLGDIDEMSDYLRLLFRALKDKEMIERFFPPVMVKDALKTLKHMDEASVGNVIVEYLAFYLSVKG